MSSSTPPSAPPAAPRPVGAPFFGWLRSLGVTRRDDAWIAGVCSGIAARTGLDPLLVRGIAIVVAILGGPVFLAYAVGWALLPDARGHIHAESAVNGHFTYPMIFIGIGAILTFLPFTRGIWFDGAPHIWGMPDWLEVTLRTLWVLALIGGAIWLTVAIARSVQQRSAANGMPTAPTAGYPSPASADAGAGTASATTSESATATAAPTDAPTASATMPGATAPEGTTPEGATTAPAADSTGAAADPLVASADPTTTPTTPTTPPAAPWSANVAWSANAAHRERHERAREDARARAAAWHAAHPHAPGAGAAFVSVVLGIALVAAAIVGIAYGAAVPDGKLVLVVSIAALVVVAIGIVIAGIRGRTTGGLGPFAFLLALVVVFTGILPAGTEVLPFGTQNVEVSQAVTSGPDSYLLLAGKTVVDASELTTRSPDGSVDVWLGAGQAEVVVPTGVPIRVESHVLAGTVTTTLGTERSGVFITDDRPFPASSSTDAQVPVIRVWLLAGNVKIVPENER